MVRWARWPLHRTLPTHFSGAGELRLVGEVGAFLAGSKDLVTTRRPQLRPKKPPRGS
jgi:hypothetical protein